MRGSKVEARPTLDLRRAEVEGRSLFDLRLSSIEAHWTFEIRREMRAGGFLGQIFNPCQMTCKVIVAVAYKVIRVQRLDSLDLKNFGPRRDFSILILRFL